jgi:signal transduction histidine kinase
LAAQNELAASNQELEERVEERTRELQAATSQLVRNERLATMGQMASIISHEIRNPLAVISNATRLIKMLVKNPDIKISRQIGIIEAEIKQANSIISEVLGYVRSREPILNKVDVSRYIHDILISYPIPPNITLVEKLEAQGIAVKIDMEEMKQAVCNLFSNAVEAMQNGGTLTVGTKAGRNVVCIYVADTGSGVPEKIREQIFAPFFTTKARGTGLGLAVVGKAVGRHEGKIFISSQEGVGSCFQIYLKIYRNIGDTRYGKTR